MKHSLLLLLAFVVSCGFPTQPTIQSQTETKKPLTLAEKLEIIESKTGYYESYRDYAPIVILKIKNVGEDAITGSIEFKYVFTDSKTGEELTNSSKYFQYGSQQIPISAGVVRQIYFQSDVVYTYLNKNKKITCSIYLENKLWGTFTVENKLLASNRIQ